MDKRARRVDTARILSLIALAAGLLVIVACMLSDRTSGPGYFVGAVLVFIGIGLRLEAAITDRR